MVKARIKKWWLLGSILLVATSFLFLKNRARTPQLEPIYFTNERYGGYRKEIAKRMNDKTQQLSGQPPTPGAWDYTEPADVGIALTDLNNDQVPEVLAQIGSRYYMTGIGGIQLEIYSQTKAGLKPIIAVEGLLEGKATRFFDSGAETSRYILKSSHMTNGYCNLYWVMGNVDPKNDRKQCLVWRDGGYTYGKSEKLRDDERAFFYDENL